jgi:DNA polymerase-1
MARDRVVLVDGSALLYRAFFALPSSLATSAGVPTNATFGFATMCRKVFAGKRPAFGAVVFDAPGATFREERFPAYKAQRPSMPAELRAQLADVDRVVHAFGLPSLRVSGYEADDVIATLTREALEAGHEVHIVSGDKDFAQLVGDHVRLVDTMRDVTYDAELVRKKWGVPPAQMRDYQALVGDKVDNVPGVPGIGAKTAVTLLERFGTLEGVLAGTAELKGKQRENLEEYAEQARLSRELVTLDERAPLPLTLAETRLGEPDASVVNALFRDLEFFSLLGAEAPAQGDAESAPPVVLAETPEALLAFRSAAPEGCALFALYAGPTPVAAELYGVALAAGTEALFVPVGGADPDAANDAGSPLRAALATALSDASWPKRVHDARDTYTVLAQHGLPLSGVVLDTQLASYLIDPTAHLPHELEQVARAFLQRVLPSLAAPDGAPAKRARPTLSDTDPGARAAFACSRALAIEELRAPLEGLLAEQDQARVMRDLELPLARVLADMQCAGVRVDAAALSELSTEFEQRKAAIEAEIFELAGRPFNLASTKQLGEVLFDELKLPVQKRTKTGYSTDAEVLERLAPKHPIAEKILRQRELAKLINTYTEVLRAAIHPRTGRVHCTFQQTASASGRLITTEPDLQRTPIRSEDGKRIRAAFLPREGWVMVSADWSQIELRLLAHLSADPALMAAFRDEVDVHRRTASEIFRCTPEEVTRAQRNVGKTVNFATIYGQGATALAQGLGSRATRPRPTSSATSRSTAACAPGWTRASRARTNTATWTPWWAAGARSQSSPAATRPRGRTASASRPTHPSRARRRTSASWPCWASRGACAKRASRRRWCCRSTTSCCSRWSPATCRGSCPSCATRWSTCGPRCGCRWWWTWGTAPRGKRRTDEGHASERRGGHPRGHLGCPRGRRRPVRGARVPVHARRLGLRGGALGLGAGARAGARRWPAGGCAAALPQAAQLRRVHLRLRVGQRVVAPRGALLPEAGGHDSPHARHGHAALGAPRGRSRRRGARAAGWRSGRRRRAAGVVHPPQLPERAGGGGRGGPWRLHGAYHPPVPLPQRGLRHLRGLRGALSLVHAQEAAQGAARRDRGRARRGRDHR